MSTGFPPSRWHSTLEGGLPSTTVSLACTRGEIQVHCVPMRKNWNRPCTYQVVVGGVWHTLNMHCIVRLDVMRSPMSRKKHLLMGTWLYRAWQPSASQVFWLLAVLVVGA